MKIDTVAVSKAVSKHLSESRMAIHQLKALPSSGVYAFFLQTPGELGRFSIEADKPIYVGFSSNLASRIHKNHLDSESTGSSTLRRSLGAIFKDKLRLTAIPRNVGKSESNVRNYRFQNEGEERLTFWMRKHLEVGIVEVGIATVSDPKLLESELVASLKPLLNLKGWSNPDRAEITTLRKVCANEARSNRSDISGPP